MQTVCVTGSQGFIGGYLCRELLRHGYRVIGIDNYSKYGRVKRDYDDDLNFHLDELDLASSNAKNELLARLITWNVDYLVAGAAMIGGISYFHKYAYDLLATNERINANTFDAAIKAYQNGSLKRLLVLSSSMVYEGADLWKEIIDNNFKDCITTKGNSIVGMPWPTCEECANTLPPPSSTYGFQKMAAEYMCKGAHEQYGLPYTIIRPFNCVGLGEEDAAGDEEVLSGNVKLMMSHVLPDLVNKVLKGQDPLHILGDGSQIRCYTHGKDIARGIRLAMESEKAVNNAYNISTSRETTVKELASVVWKTIKGNTPLELVSDEAYKYDVQKRIPDVNKAKEHLGFVAEISLEDSVQEVVEHMKRCT